MKLPILAVAALALMAPAGAHAAAFVASFNGICTSSATTTTAKCTDNGAYGNAVTLKSTNDASLQVKITAWQAAQTNDTQAYTAINAAFLGAYDGGFGVTGINDQSGGNSLHQIDNQGGYTDFVMLQFSRDVQLGGVRTNLYQPAGDDSDISIFNAASLIKPVNWNDAVNLAASPYGYSQIAAWTNIAGPSTASTISTGTPGFSKVWLVSASMLTTDRNDGFKLAQLFVQPQIPPIPEPATWAMMIAGFGAIGAALRRRATGALKTA